MFLRLCSDWFYVFEEIVDFEDLSKSQELFVGCDVGYCAMGTARSEEGTKQFIKVDYDYTMSVAKIAKEQGCRQFHLISSDSASKTSKFLYLKIKGKVEAEIEELGFDQFFVYRPALILRGEKSRAVERIYSYIIKPVTSFKPEWGQVSIEVVAKSMVKKSECFGVEGTDKVTILANADIHKVAKELTSWLESSLVSPWML